MTNRSESKAHLRPMKESDLAMVLEWRNHPDVRRYMYTQAEISMLEHERWFKAVSEEAGCFLLIFEIDTIPCGYVNFRCYDSERAVWGFYLAPNAPKGTGRSLGRAAIDYAFDVLGLQEITGEVLPDNVASQNFHLRQGFVLESVLSDKAVGQLMVGNVHKYILTKSVWLARQGISE